MYTLEGFLARLALSTQAGDFVLKGGVLMAAFADRRPTRDIDLLASGFANEIAECEGRVRDIANIPFDDGLTFDRSSVKGEFIRDEADYTGVRVHISATLASAQLGIHVDISFGDPIWPGPTETDLPRLRWNGPAPGVPRPHGPRREARHRHPARNRQHPLARLRRRVRDR